MRLRAIGKWLGGWVWELRPYAWRARYKTARAEELEQIQITEEALRRNERNLRELEGLRAQMAAGYGALPKPPGLTPAEIERLAMLSEECGELIRVIGKVLRHGWTSTAPQGTLINRVAVEREVGHVNAAVSRLTYARDIRWGNVRAWQKRTERETSHWTHHQPVDLRETHEGNAPQ